MNAPRVSRMLLLSAAALVMASAAVVAQNATTKPFEPTVGQAGKDVVWVPTPQPLVEKMLDLAKVTPQDFLMDLGSGDGRTVITAAKRGLRAQGVEYNPDMVDLSKRNAAAAGVGEKATFVKADLFETDFSKAQVVTMFLLPSINMRLRPTILKMKPGTRIVSNTFTMEDWMPDQTETISGDCVSWCTALLWIVPAQVDGTWQLGSNALTLKQNFQMLTGTLGSAKVTGRLRGDEITLTADNMKYAGKVEGNTMKGSNWSATRK
ncbi:MAG TPA: class I SAM-dependent methyltransferase [Vicinamibacterales bacterium]|nr:class I SAM-dependent methyltransferase [Vicinamibacterales bacterium]